MYCTHCKTKENLMKLCVSTSGRRHHICRKCNTEKHIKYRSTKSGKEKTYKAVYKSIKKMQNKQNSRAKVGNAIRSGKLNKPFKCSSCHKKLVVFAHHEDYSKPLNVMWLCRSCHANKHKSI